MACFGGLGIGLSIAFGCLLLAFGAEVYYLLWRKRRIIRVAVVTPSPESAHSSPDYTHYAKELLTQLICWKKKPSSQSQSGQQDLIPDPKACGGDGDLELGGAGMDFFAKQFGGGEESVESELMRLHNLSGPPRFLFTINEETREDMESNDGKSRKGSRARSLSDMILALDTPFLTPLPSPPLKTSSLNSSPHLDSYNNPLFESSVRPPASPPPKFKFLRDAEEKLCRRLKEEEAAKARLYSKDDTQAMSNNSTDSSAAQHSRAVIATSGSSSSQVLPLDSSPAALGPAPGNNTAAPR